MYNQRVKRNFNKYASSYDENAVVQKVMAENLIGFLRKEKKSAGTILDIGCGTGYFSKMLQDRFKPDRLFLNDISENMLKIAAARTANNSNCSIEILEKDSEELRLERNKFDLITANAVIQWITDINKFFSNISKSLVNEGIFGFSTFIKGTFYELEKVFTSIYRNLNIKNKKHTINFYTEPLLKHELETSGFEIIITQVKKYIYHYKNAFEFLKQLRNTGAASFKNGTVKYRIMKRLNESYLKMYGTGENLIPVTYNIIYCIAMKKS